MPNETLALPEPSVATWPRYDSYAEIHKALRAFMGDTLTRVGSLDPWDAEEVAAVMGQTRDLLGLCRTHLEHEDRFIHPAMEARQPGSTAVTAGDHAGHEAALEALAEALAALEASRDREQAVRGLYRSLARFVAENLEHMEREERDNNPVLWAHYTDEEIVAIERALIASIPPGEMGLALSWMIPAMNPGERVRKLAGIRAKAPEPVFRQILALAEDRLPKAAWERLQRDLR